MHTSTQEKITQTSIKKTTRLRHYFFDLNKKLKAILEQGFPTGEQRGEFECEY